MTIEQALTRVYEEKTGDHSPASGRTALDALNVLLENANQYRVNDLGEGLYTMLTKGSGGRAVSITGSLDTIADDLEDALEEFGVDWDTFARLLKPGAGLAAYIDIMPDETAQQAGAEPFYCPFWNLGDTHVGFITADQADEGARIVYLAIYSPEEVNRIRCGFYDTANGTWVPFNELFSHISYTIYFTLVM